MRNYFLLTSLLLSIVLSGCSLMKGMTSEEKKANERALHEAIEKRDFHIDVNHIIPGSGIPRTLSSGFTLDIRNENVKSHLPYEGIVTSVPFGGGEGLIFESKIEKYESTFDSKGRTNIEFQTKTKEDLYVYRIQIYPEGKTSINVTSNNKQAISFKGNAVPRRR